MGTVGKTKLKVFHAGSLSVPLKEIEDKFEAQNPTIDIQREPYGSVVAVRQITEVGKKGDVIAVSDYTLIPSMMYPEYADFYLQFARNRMALLCTEKSKYQESISSDNWYNILRKDEVTFGFSNPNNDPNGYRSLIVLKLAELYYRDGRIFEDLVTNLSAIKIRGKDDGYLITVPESLNPFTLKLLIRPKEVDFIAPLEAGGLDYVFNYMSVGKQHGLKTVTLPKQIDLSSTEYKDLYEKVKVKTADGKVSVGKPIVYGISVPKNAPHPELGIKFIKFVIGEEGRKSFESLGQPPIVPPVTSGKVPPQLKQG